MTKHTCSHCHQNLYPVHPLHVRAAINYLRFLSKDPDVGITSKRGVEWHYRALMGNGREWTRLAQAADHSIPDTTKAAIPNSIYEIQNTPALLAEYNRLRGLELAQAAMKLSDGWLPIGTVLDPNMSTEGDCPAFTDLVDPDNCPHRRESGIRFNCNCKMQGCSHKKENGDFYCYLAWL